MKKYAFGVDIGGTTCKIGFFETTGKMIDKWEIKTNTENNGESILSDVAKAVDNKLAQEAISKDDVQGIGIGVPGPVDSLGIVHRCVNLGWGVVNVAEELESLTGLKVKVGNDANVAALGEMWQGGAQRLQGCYYGNTWNRCRRRYYCGRQDRSRIQRSRWRDWTYHSE